MTPLYREHSLGPPLDTFVECVWILRTGRRTAGAGGVPHLQPAAFLLAPSCRPLLLEPCGPMETVGIRFRPGGAAAFLRIPVDRLGDGEVPLDLLFGRFGAELPERLAEARTDAGRVALLEDLLLRRLVERKVDPERP